MKKTIISLAIIRLDGTKDIIDVRSYREVGTETLFLAIVRLDGTKETIGIRDYAKIGSREINFKHKNKHQQPLLDEEPPKQ